MRSQQIDRFALAMLLGLLTLPALSCGRAMFVPPAGPGEPAAGAAEAWTEATAACRDARTYSALVTLSGRVAGRRFPGLTVSAAFSADGSTHMQAHYSGRQVFLLAGRADRASLWLRYDDNRVVTAPLEAIVEALADVRLGGDDLLAMLTGCPVQQRGVIEGRQYGEVMAITTPGGRLYLRRQPAGWRVRAAEVDGLLVDYPKPAPGLPPEVAVATLPDRTPAVSLRFRAEQIELNQALAPQLFALPPGAAGAAPMTLEELRTSGPLRGSGDDPPQG